MKKYYEYDAPVLTKLVSIVAIVAICVSMFTSAFCCYKIASMNGTVVQTNNGSSVNGGSSSDNGGSSDIGGSTETPTVADDTNGGTETPADNGGASTDTPAADNGSAGTDSGTATKDTTKSNSSSSSSAGTIKGLSTNAEILKKYNEVVTAASNAKLGFTKIEYQTLPEQYRNLGTLGNIILPIAEGFMTTEEKAKADPQISKKGEDHASRWPNANLDDATFIKSAKATQSGDLVTIVITLKDESNPEPAANHGEKAPSKTGCMFTPMSKADIDNTIAGISAVKVNSFDLTYTDCTTTLVYNAKTNQVQSLTQVMNIDIKANIKAVLVTIDGSARLVNTLKIYDIQY